MPPLLITCLLHHFTPSALPVRCAGHKKTPYLAHSESFEDGVPVTHRPIMSTQTPARRSACCSRSPCSLRSAPRPLAMTARTFSAYSRGSFFSCGTQSALVGMCGLGLDGVRPQVKPLQQSCRRQLAASAGATLPAEGVQMLVERKEESAPWGWACRAAAPQPSGGW